jgi:hypothetical protein
MPLASSFMHDFRSLVLSKLFISSLSLQICLQTNETIGYSRKKPCHVFVNIKSSTHFVTTFLFICLDKIFLKKIRFFQISKMVDLKAALPLLGSFVECFMTF